MSQTTLSTAAAGARELGLIGTRQLHAVQMIDIGRLTYHVVPFVPGTFVAISGRGPKDDSNETGKTTFLAATSLLLGDSEWRLRSGGQHASTLLFNPHAVGAAEHLADPADHGYVIGLFAQAGEPPTDPLSVWMRINRASPYLEIKAELGQTFVDSDDDRPAPLAAHDHWSQMNHLGSGRTLGASSFVDALYGNAPRCIAHLNQTRRPAIGVSLLNSNAGSFTREQIGDALVVLASRQDMLDEDRSQRGHLGEVERQLAQRRGEADERERAYERQLAELDGRDHARQQLSTAEHDWKTHNARRYLDGLDAAAAKKAEHAATHEHVQELEIAVSKAASAVAVINDNQALRERHAAARSALAEADHHYLTTLERHAKLEQAVSASRETLRDLHAKAANWAGPDTEQTEAAEQAAREALRSAEHHLSVTDAAAEAARDLLTRAQQGRADATTTLETLERAGISAHGLLDTVTLDPATEPSLESLLWPYRDAVVIVDDHLDAALEALAPHPWAMVIAGPPDHVAPTAVSTYPPGAGRFLTALEARARPERNPDRASDTALGVTVISGSIPLAGRNARIRAATAALAKAEAGLAVATTARQEAALNSDARAEDHQRATAAADARLLAKTLTEHEHGLDQARAARTSAEQQREAATELERDLAVQLAGLDAARDRAATDLAHVQETLRHKQHDLEALEVELQALQDAARAVESQWHAGEQAARERCLEDPRDEGRLRYVANEALHEALYALGMRRDEDWAPSDELIYAWRRRHDDESTAPFPVLAEPLAAHLDEFADRDIVLRERIQEDRERTAEAIGAAELEVVQTRAGLARIQDAIVTSVEAAIAAIGDEFDRLDKEAGGYGAALELEIRAPIDAPDSWHWSVTPMWRRSPDGRMVPYTAPTNSAQDKLYTVNLVLAALLAVPNPEGRVLILDELGDSLGSEHRREMLRAIAETAEEKQITVLGTCQDDVLHHAADFAQEIVFFEYADNRDLLNRPVRLFGYDPQGTRIELTRDAVLHGRPLV